jgi:hypothetical protein
MVVLRGWEKKVEGLFAVVCQHSLFLNVSDPERRRRRVERFAMTTLVW